MTKEHRQLIQAIDELRSIKDTGSIRRPHESYFLAYIFGDVARTIKVKRRGVSISRRSIKHILERRGSNAEIVFSELKYVIERPTKIVDNSKKRKDSFIFIRSADITVAAIIEITEKPGTCQVVSAFLMGQKTYEKLIDISGRAEFPPFELPS
jgi:hypothetical protein